MRFVLILVTAIAAGLAAALIVIFTRGTSSPAQPPAAGAPMTTQAKTQRMAEAIAKAEGFYVAGSVAQRANNPGNLKLPGHAGHGDIHGKTIFGTPDEGWAALRRQIDLMRTGQSAYYKPSMTFLEIARIYTGGDKPDAWARIVTGALGLSPQNKLAEYFG